MPAQQNTAQRRDIHAEITSKLIASIEADPGQPSMPWRRSSGPLFMPTNALTGNAYNGINIVSLWVSAEVSGFTAPVWATYRLSGHTYLEIGRIDSRTLAAVRSSPSGSRSEKKPS